MIRLPVETTSSKFVVAGPVTPNVDRETKLQRVDENGQPLFDVPLLLVGVGATHEVMVVRVAGEPKGLSELGQVKLTDLILSTWTSKNGREGFSFRAAKVGPLRPAQA